MSRTRAVVFFFFLLGAVVAAGSCTPDGRSPTEATPAGPSTDLVGSLLSSTGLLQCTPLPYASTTQTVGPDGGVIRVGPHWLTIPAGALAAPVKITAELPVANVNSVRFSPQGLTFSRPATLWMSYQNCSLLGKLLPKRIAYTTDDFSIISYLLSIDVVYWRHVYAPLDHFSTYAVAW